MRSSRALVFPSIWYEAQPLTTMEAAACGLAVIAADKSAAVEQIHQLGVGEIYPGGDADALAEIMRRYSDTAFAREQGRASREAFLRLDLSEERYLEHVMHIYQRELQFAK